MLIFLGLLILCFTDILSAAQGGSGRAPTAKSKGKRQAEANEQALTPPPFEVMRNDILGLRVGRIIPETDWMSNIPSEVWVEIFKHVSTYPVDFFNSLSICKTLFAILQNNCNVLLADAITNESAIVNVLRNTEIQFNYKMFDVLRKEIMYLSATLGKLRERDDNDLNWFKLDIFHNTDDLQLLSDIFALKVKSKMLLPKIIYNLGLTDLDIYCPIGCRMHYFVPSDEHERLFEEVDPRLVVIATSYSMSFKFSSMFVPSLIADYIVPSYFDKSLLSGPDLKAIRATIKHTDINFYGYFQNLLWACYFLTGEIRRSEKSTITHIASHLEHLGFQWPRLFSKFPSKKQLPRHMLYINMGAMFKVAQQWGLNIRLIAKNTQSWYAGSAAIMAGDLPNNLIVPEKNSIVEVIKLMHPLDCELCQQILTEKGYTSIDTEGNNRLVPVYENVQEVQALHPDNLNQALGTHFYEPPTKRQRTQYDPINYNTQEMQPAFNQMAYQHSQFLTLPQQSSAFNPTNMFIPQPSFGPQQQQSSGSGFDPTNMLAYSPLQQSHAFTPANMFVPQPGTHSSMSMNVPTNISITYGVFPTADMYGRTATPPTVYNGPITKPYAASSTMTPQPIAVQLQSHASPIEPVQIRQLPPPETKRVQAAAPIPQIEDDVEMKMAFEEVDILPWALWEDFNELFTFDEWNSNDGKQLPKGL